MSATPSAEPLGAYAVGREDPGRPAVVGPEGITTTFGELGRRADRLSGALRGLGLTGGDVVCAVLHNCVEYFELLLAIQQSGLYLVPVNVHLAAEEIAYIVGDSGAKVLVASADLAEALAGTVDALPAERFTVGGAVEGWQGYERLRASGDGKPPAERRFGMMMGYTSGTTGRPKGVRRKLPPVTPELALQQIPSYLGQFGFEHGRGVHLLFSPLYHAAPGNFALNALHLGQTVVLRRKFDAVQALTDIEQFGVTSLHAVPTHLHRIMRLPEELRLGFDTSSLQTVLVAGAPFAPEAKKAVLDWLGPVVWEYFASTEGMVCAVGPQEALERPGTLGRPAAVRILDEDGKDLPPGEIGTIYFAMGPVAFEYHNDPEKTARAVRPDGYATAGDLGRLDEDGYLYLADRRDDLIITGGVNVYPAEVEQRLIGHPAVADVAVVGVPDPEWGASAVAVVQLEPGYAPGTELGAELDRHCREALAGLKCPRRYEFREELPRTPTGKLLRRAVRESMAG